MKLRWWYGLAFNMILAALVISNGAWRVRTAKENRARTEGQRTEGSSVLEIRDTATGKVYGTWFLNPDEEFAVEFIHSVHQSPVRETFVVEEKMILPRETRFFSFGAGMQSDLEEGQTLSREGNALVISGFRNSFNELNYIVGTVSDHVLYVKGETISLRELCGKNAHISLCIRH